MIVYFAVRLFSWLYEYPWPPDDDEKAFFVTLSIVELVVFIGLFPLIADYFKNLFARGR